MSTYEIHLVIFCTDPKPGFGASHCIFRSTTGPLATLYKIDRPL